MESFWSACEAAGPLIIEVEESEVARPIRYAFDRPSVLIGSGPGSDLRIEHPGMSRRHAYLQMIAGHPFLVDLDSRTGILNGDEKTAGGWVVSGRPIRIGPALVRFPEGWGAEGHGPAPGSNPLSSKGYRANPRPSISLVVDEGPEVRSIPITRTLTLIGRSRRCMIRLGDARASRFLCALLRTPGGVWVVDLRSTGGVSVNGTRVNHAKLEDGDEVRVGPLVARLSNPDSSSNRGRSPGLGNALAFVQPTGSEGGDLRPLLEQAAGLHDPSSDQFGRMILLLTQMMGTMHREMVDLVREELEQIRRLAAEMQALRAEAQAGTQGKLEAPPSTVPEEAEPVAPSSRKDPVDVHLFVAERLEAFERERQGHWNRISKILFKSGR